VIGFQTDSTKKIHYMRVGMGVSSWWM